MSNSSQSTHFISVTPYPVATMAFQAVPNFVGVPNFGLIHINPQETAKAFQAYLDTASKLTGVSLEDINRRVIKVPADPARVTLTDLLGLGMKLFDSIVWLTAGRPTSHPLVADPTMDKNNIPSLHEVARSVFYTYFMLLTQARYPAPRAATEKPRIPNFLRVIMGMADDQYIYIERICSFAPQKFDPSWVKFVEFQAFGQEVLSRFGLGVAGYRMFGPFALYEPKADISFALKESVEFANSIARKPASWNIHPLTRNPNILTARGNLNKNLGNLILDVFTEEQIAEMVSAKVLYAKPEREAAHRNYLQWAREDDITGTALIFRQPSS
jgi:hypothetical protein